MIFIISLWHICLMEKMYTFGRSLWKALKRITPNTFKNLPPDAFSVSGGRFYVPMGVKSVLTRGYRSVVLAKRIKTVATCARVAKAAGARVVSLVPVSRPESTAHSIAGSAQLPTCPASV